MTFRNYLILGRGLIGSAFARYFIDQNINHYVVNGHKHYDLRNYDHVFEVFSKSKPDVVIMAAGKVAGILENTKMPADFLNTNLVIQQNIYNAALHFETQKIIFFASSCMYPKNLDRPMSEMDLLSGRPEETSMSYAIAKLAGLQFCLAANKQFMKKQFLPLIPNSIFGPHDNFNPEKGHVLSSLIHRFHCAKKHNKDEIILWGNGQARREFVYVDDVVHATMHVLQYNKENIDFPINIGVGRDISIYELADIIATLIGYKGRILWDHSKPNGASRKLLNSARLNELGWTSERDFRNDIIKTYEWYCTHKDHALHE